MELSDAQGIPVLDQYGIGQRDLETMIDVMPLYGFVKNKGQLDDSEDYLISDEGLLEDDEKPGRFGRDGESELTFAYDDFQYHFEGMIDGESFGISDDEVLELPEEDRDEAAGALFGASYAFFRSQVMEEGYPAEHATFRQDIDSQDGRKRFLEEGALEIEGEVMGPWGYDHEKMNEIMDAGTALRAYNDVAEEIA